MNITDKKTVVLRGWLMPLTLGESAVIYHAGGVTRTSVVVAIEGYRHGYMFFETKNSRYRVQVVPDAQPQRAVPPLPICA
jgi:hypothetical protein